MLFKCSTLLKQCYSNVVLFKQCYSNVVPLNNAIQM